jgi:hypothetical protein
LEQGPLQVIVVLAVAVGVDVFVVVFAFAVDGVGVADVGGGEDVADQVLQVRTLLVHHDAQLVEVRVQESLLENLIEVEVLKVFKKR